MKLYQLKVTGELKLRLPPATAPLAVQREYARALRLLYPDAGIEIVGMDVNGGEVTTQRKIRVIGA